jgi:hypothetical protein
MEVKHYAQVRVDRAVIFRRRYDGRVISVLLVESTFLRLDQLAPSG